MDENESRPLRPGDTIGILGGGQLGRMLAIAAARLGFRTLALDPDDNAPARQVCNQHITARYDDEKALFKLAETADVVTYEFENIPLATARFIEAKGHLRPGSLALENSQDRLVEKRFLNDLAIATAPFAPVDDIGALNACFPDFPEGGILKTRRFGYDGKGQSRLTKTASKSTLEEAWREIGETPAILEGLIDFEREISVIAGRGIDGECAAFDPAENTHRHGILRQSKLPAAIDGETAAKAQKIAFRILDALDYVGVLGVEFFLTPQRELLVNEIAPRVHNSGHWTEAACAISQFEQHIRAIAGWPLGAPTRHSDCVMENLIGEAVDDYPALLPQEDVLLHLYGKSETRPGRKMGHFTRLTGTASTVLG